MQYASPKHSFVHINYGNEQVASNKSTDQPPRMESFTYPGSRDSIKDQTDKSQAAPSSGPLHESALSCCEPSTSQNVRFGTVQVREYERTLCDHPGVRVGPPISIGWRYDEHEAKDLDEYERTRPPRKIVLRMNSMNRITLLKNQCHISETEIIRAEKQVQKDKASRKRSAKYSTVELGVVDATEKIGNTFLRLLPVSPSLRDAGERHAVSITIQLKTSFPEYNATDS